MKKLLRWTLIGAWALCGLCGAVSAGQTRAPRSSAPETPAYVSIKLGSALEALPGPWRFKTGDDPAWAQPGFPDADWQLVNLTPPSDSVDPGLGSSGYTPGWTAQGHPQYAGFAWYRLRVRVDAGGKRLALLMPADVDDAYQIYANGRLIGGFGDFSKRPPRTYYSRPQIFRLPASADSMVVLALRFYMRPASLLEDPTPGGLHAPPALGIAQTTGAYFQLTRDAYARTYGFYLLPVLFFFLAAIAAFTLFFLDRSQKVFFWLGSAALLNVAYLVFVLLAILTTAVDDRLLVLRPILLAIVLWTWLLVWWSWFDLARQRWLLRLINGFSIAAIVLAWLQHALLGRTMYPYEGAGVLGLTGRAVHLILSLLPLAMLWLILRTRQRDGWIVAPALVLLSVSIYPEPLVWLHIPLLWFIHGVQISSRLAAELGISMWVILLLLLRFQRSQRVQQQLQMEMRQAQQVQHTLLPDAPATLPGFHVESLYRPAAEVGGDFFQILPSVDGGLLVVIGDVNGKGLRAAMLVSLIVGMLRTFAERDLEPGELLTGMNRRLCGRMEGGFATCLCARICPDGSMMIANAGHLAPYLDGQEMEVPAGLPLGIVASLEYGQQKSFIPAGSVLVFLTDGIVEARNRKGEIFSFERTAPLTRKSLQEIASPAQGFHQDDDVTAIRIQREIA